MSCNEEIDLCRELSPFQICKCTHHDYIYMYVVQRVYHFAVYMYVECLDIFQILNHAMYVTLFLLQLRKFMTMLSNLVRMLELYTCTCTN